MQLWSAQTSMKEYLQTIGGLSSTGTRVKLKLYDPVKFPSFTVMDIVRDSGRENSDTLVPYLN